MDLIAQAVEMVGKTELVVMVIAATIIVEATIHYYEFKDFKMTRKDVD